MRVGRIRTDTRVVVLAVPGVLVAERLERREVREIPSFKQKAGRRIDDDDAPAKVRHGGEADALRSAGYDGVTVG